MSSSKEKSTKRRVLGPMDSEDELLIQSYNKKHCTNPKGEDASATDHSLRIEYGNLSDIS
jgi:hypothetical protein